MRARAPSSTRTRATSRSRLPARGAFESRSRGVDPFPRPYGTARVVDGASNAERFDVHAGMRMRASSEASSRWRSADYDLPRGSPTSPEDAVGSEIRPELDVGARSPATDHLDQLDQLDPHEVAISPSTTVTTRTRPPAGRTTRRTSTWTRHTPHATTPRWTRAPADERRRRRERDRRASSGAAELRPRERCGPYDGVARVVVSATRASRPSHASPPPRAPRRLRRRRRARRPRAHLRRGSVRRRARRGSANEMNGPAKPRR